MYQIWNYKDGQWFPQKITQQLDGAWIHINEEWRLERSRQFAPTLAQLITPGYINFPRWQELMKAQAGTPTTPLRLTNLGTTLEDTFRALCTQSVPHGSEHARYGALLTELNFETLPRQAGFYLSIPDSEGHLPVMFIAHLDDVSKDVISNTLTGPPEAVTAPGGVLGADDRAGVSLIIQRVREGRPGQYLLTTGEESGLIGARIACQQGIHTRHVTNQIISLDRNGTRDVITEMNGHPCCSAEYAKALCASLNLGHVPSNQGRRTDATMFIDRNTEVTNLAVGYTGEHGRDEQMNLTYLNSLNAALNQINWRALPCTGPSRFLGPAERHKPNLPKRQSVTLKPRQFPVLIGAPRKSLLEKPFAGFHGPEDLFKRIPEMHSGVMLGPGGAWQVLLQLGYRRSLLQHDKPFGPRLAGLSGLLTAQIHYPYACAQLPHHFQKTDSSIDEYLDLFPLVSMTDEQRAALDVPLDRNQLNEVMGGSLATHASHQLQRELNMLPAAERRGVTSVREFIDADDSVYGPISERLNALRREPQLIREAPVLMEGRLNFGQGQPITEMLTEWAQFTTSAQLNAAVTRQETRNDNQDLKNCLRLARNKFITDPGAIRRQTPFRHVLQALAVDIALQPEQYPDVTVIPPDRRTPQYEHPQRSAAMQWLEHYYLHQYAKDLLSQAGVHPVSATQAPDAALESSSSSDSPDVSASIAQESGLHRKGALN